MQQFVFILNQRQYSSITDYQQFASTLAKQYPAHHILYQQRVLDQEVLIDAMQQSQQHKRIHLQARCVEDDSQKQSVHEQALQEQKLQSSSKKNKKDSKLKRIEVQITNQLMQIIQLKINMAIPQIIQSVLKIIQQPTTNPIQPDHHRIHQKIDQYCTLSRKYAKQIAKTIQNDKFKKQKKSNHLQKIDKQQYNQPRKHQQPCQQQQNQTYKQPQKQQQKPQKKLKKQLKEKNKIEIKTEKKDNLQQKVKKRCQKMSLFFGQQASNYEQFVISTLKFSIEEVKNIYAQENNLSLEYLTKQKMQTKMCKLAYFFGEEKQKYRNVVERNPKASIDQLLKILKNEGIQDYEDSKYEAMRIRRMKSRKVKIEQPLIQLQTSKQQWEQWIQFNGSVNLETRNEQAVEKQQQLHSSHKPKTE